MALIDTATKIKEWLWEFPRDESYGMLVPARVYTEQAMLEEIAQDRSLDQLRNMSTLPGIQSYALAMPDIHEGYGFPVGGVAAFDLEEGIISPGGIGYDINCGVRLLRCDLVKEQLKGKENEIGHELKRAVPSGVGQGGQLRLSHEEIVKVLEEGAQWAVSRGYGTDDDLEHIESGGILEEADASKVSDRAKKRGLDQVGTLGAGNHFVDVLYVNEVYDEGLAGEWGLEKDTVTVMIHTGSRGLGHQIATDYVRIMMGSLAKYGISLKDRELACAPFNSPEGRDYFAAMCAGANFAWANRQLITHAVRDSWMHLFASKEAKLDLVYDVAHNIAKIEEHDVGGKQKRVVVHRKGATRAFPGQPVIIPGSMGTPSYVLVGEESSMKESFGSTCHGAGRRMSRTRAKKETEAVQLKKKLESKGIYVHAGSYRSLAEESPNAYKDVDSVVDVVDKADIARKVVRLQPVVVAIG